MQNEIIFAFDIPRNQASFRVKVWRKLKKLDAKQDLGSFWTLKYSEYKILQLKLLAEEIIDIKGRAKIIEGKVIWKK